MIFKIISMLENVYATNGNHLDFDYSQFHFVLQTSPAAHVSSASGPFPELRCDKLKMMEILKRQEIPFSSTTIYSLLFENTFAMSL
jgi:hypothetical protein